MKILLNIVGVLFLLAGGVWFVQGVGVLPGSFMTGSQKWAIIGGICVVLGIALLLSANRSSANRDAT